MAGDLQSVLDKYIYFATSSIAKVLSCSVAIAFCFSLTIRQGVKKYLLKCVGKCNFICGSLAFFVVNKRVLVFFCLETCSLLVKIWFVTFV